MFRIKIRTRTKKKKLKRMLNRVNLKMMLIRPLLIELNPSLFEVKMLMMTNTKKPKIRQIKRNKTKV